MKGIAAVEFLTTARLGEKGQVTVPREFRKALGLESGSVLAVLRFGSALMLIPEEARFQSLCRRISDAFGRHGTPTEDILATLPQVRREMYERRYPGLAKKSSRTKRKPPRP